ncbi:hypothetical protein [Streptomyces tailanensis]|uniref:hypothetical protein n=1 Tax=Streptomyces tailanensis TaxID=2569858 RepID=UPI00122E2909|nr:hypothetical protein [Streptomyces tailanensis]
MLGGLRDAQGESPERIPPLLTRIAYGDEATARLAVDELGGSLCALGFVVGEATAPAVPFLLELAGAPHLPCKAELLGLLESICRARQWQTAAAAAARAGGGGLGADYRRQPGWERAARAAVYTGRPIVESLASSVRPEEAGPARSLLRSMDEAALLPETES